MANWRRISPADAVDATITPALLHVPRAPPHTTWLYVLLKFTCLLDTLLIELLLLITKRIIGNDVCRN